MKNYIHMNTFTEKRVIALFSTAAGLRTYSFTKKGLHIGGILVKFVKFYRISFLQETARRLLLLSSNISDISLALLAVNQPSLSWLSRTSRRVTPEKCLNTEIFLVRIFLHLDWIRRFTPYSVRIRENTDQKKLRIWTLFTQWAVR